MIKKVLHITDSLGGGVNQVIRDIMIGVDKKIYISETVTLRKNKNVAPNLLSWIKLFSKIKKSFNAYDILHFHGAWSAFLLLIIKKPNRPLVITPHGAFTISSMKKSKNKKIIVKYLYMRRAYSNADVIHALTERDAKEIREWGGRC